MFFVRYVVCFGYLSVMFCVICHLSGMSVMLCVLFICHFFCVILVICQSICLFFLFVSYAVSCILSLRLCMFWLFVSQVLWLVVTFSVALWLLFDFANFPKVWKSILNLMSCDFSPGKKMLHVDKVFSRMDRDGDGVVTKEEFLSYCMNTSTVWQSLGFLP